MPRNYTKKANKTRSYGSCSREDLEKAIDACRNEGYSLRKACQVFGVKKSTLSDHLNKPMKKVGRPTALSSADEMILAKLIDEVAEWGFPIGKLEIKMMVKDLLDKKGMVSPFKDNIPGDDWFNYFMQRNKLSGRMASNIKRARSSVDENVINDFFDHLLRSLQGFEVEAHNIFNYDETNVTDDPGREWVIVRRGRRRVENVMEHSKTAVSLMWCGNAAGRMLAPMVVYKALNVYEGWTRGGPTGTVYANTKSGWFDSEMFELWFRDSFLPQVATIEGPKFLFGDNLASHFNDNVVKLAKENNIYFIMLPPNATNLMQPLDVSVYGPMKRVWRSVLLEWRKEARHSGAFPKEYFPSLLNRLNNSIQGTVSGNLISGFETCGLYPIDRIKVLNKLPSSSRTDILDTGTILNESVTNLLKKNRGTDEEKRKRGKKIPKVKPGAILGCEIDEQKEDDEIEDEELSEDEVCDICYKTDDIVENNENSDDEVDWVGCENCSRWYHETCLMSVAGEGRSCTHCP